MTSVRSLPARRACRLAVFLAFAAAAAAAADPRLDYPVPPRSNTVDDYHGVKVADPFRPLENLDDPAVRDWIVKENALTRSVLDRTRQPKAILGRLEALNDYARMSLPVERGGKIFTDLNSGLQNQSVYRVQDGLAGAPRVLLDPNLLRADGTVAVTAWSPSPDGSRVAFALSEAGSDWETLHVLDVATGRTLPDSIPWVKFTEPSWEADGSGFYYGRQPAPGTVPAGEEHYYRKVYRHTVGDDPADDALIYERPDVKEAFPEPAVTEDGAWLVITVARGAAPESEVYLRPLVPPGGSGSAATLPADWNAIRPLFTGFDASYQLLGKIGRRLYFLTDKDAPNKRVIALDPETRHPDPATVIPEGSDVITDARVAGGKLVVETLHDASSRVAVYGGDGALVAPVTLPALGSASVSGHPSGDLAFLSFTSFLYPTVIERLDLATGALSPFFTPKVDVDAADYVTRQVWYESKDGTKVPMFLVHKRGLALTGDHPTLLYGYGGFDISMTPFFSASLLYWLEHGGIYAMPNIRGGGEFGEAWHRAGMLEHKQNVFDDFIAAAEYLIDNGYTRPERLAVRGGSNGGLLAAVVTNQRPDLFGASVIQVPVADMLRYQLFTVARFWVPEYGSAENPDQFPFLYAYSPLQNVKPGLAYPAILITTGESDNRVHPGQVLKLAAALQADGSDRPVLLRVNTRAGHGGGKPISKRLEEDADIDAFLQLALHLKWGWRARRGSGLGELFGEH